MIIIMVYIFSFCSLLLWPKLYEAILTHYNRFETIGHLLPYPELYFTKDEIKRYNEDIAIENERRQWSGNLTSSKGYYNCTSLDGIGNRDQVLKENLNVSSLDIIKCYPSMLPFDKQNIEDILSAMTWKARSSSLCDVVVANNRFNKNNAIMKYDNKRVPVVKLIFFGGSMTKGSGTEGACCCVDIVDSSCPGLSACRRYNGAGNDAYCGWTGYISRWFQSAFPHVQFEFVDFSDHGRTSLVSANLFSSMIENLNMTLSSSDIVFLDHSVNDAYSCLKAANCKAKLGLETLIREIIHHTINSDGSWPNIILIEQYPKADKLAVYPPFYREIAKHYNLPLWSYPSFVYSTYAAKYQSHFVNTLKDHGTHPPWHVHMLIADLFSGAFMTTLERECKQSLENCSMSKKTTEMPSILYDVHDISQAVCADKASHLVFATATENDSATMANCHCDIDRPHDSPVACQGWHQYTDRHVPGFIIDFCSGSSIEKRKLEFPFNKELPRGSLLKIEYLRSYEKAGKFQVQVCGKVIDVVDSLLSQKHAHFSMPDFYTYRLSDEIYSTCRNLSQDQRVVVIEFIPSPINEPGRLTQKVKILNIEVCG